MPNFHNFSPSSKVKSSDDEDRRNSDNRPYSKRTREHSAYKIHEEARKKKRYNDDIDSKDRRYHSSRHKSHKMKKHVFDRIGKIIELTLTQLHRQSPSNDCHSEIRYPLFRLSAQVLRQNRRAQTHRLFQRETAVGYQNFLPGFRREGRLFEGRFLRI